MTKKKFDHLKKKFSSSTLTVIGFIILLAVTWFYLSKPSFKTQQAEKNHSLLQLEFQNLLSAFIEKKHPEVIEISFHKVWTKTTSDPSEVDIFFSYSLKTEGTTGGSTSLKGSALLKKIQNEVWQVHNFKVENTELKFSTPLLIKANPK